jgi:hypothetical protein
MTVKANQIGDVRLNRLGFWPQGGVLWAGCRLPPCQQSQSGASLEELSSEPSAMRLCVACGCAALDISGTAQACFTRSGLAYDVGVPTFCAACDACARGCGAHHCRVSAHRSAGLHASLCCSNRFRRVCIRAMKRGRCFRCHPTIKLVADLYSRRVWILPVTHMQGKRCQRDIKLRTQGSISRCFSQRLAHAVHPLVRFIGADRKWQMTSA